MQSGIVTMDDLGRRSAGEAHLAHIIPAPKENALDVCISQHIGQFAIDGHRLFLRVFGGAAGNIPGVVQGVSTVAIPGL